MLLTIFALLATFYFYLGQVCVARFPDDGLWYRALITASPTQQTVEVFYVDYGNSCQVFKSDLRLMRYKYYITQQF